jgi:GNAT superfamily N-acetyltransferase
MDLSACFSRFNFERREVAWPGERLEILPEVTRRSSDDGSRHGISFSDFQIDEAESVVAAQVAHYRNLNVEFEWTVFEWDSPSRLQRYLFNRGFEVGAAEAVLVRLVDGHQDWPAADPRISVRRVERRDQIPEYRSVAESVFEKDYSFTSGQLEEAIQSGRTDHIGYIGYWDSHPVAVGRLYSSVVSEFGGLYGGGTLPEFRGRGLYRAIVKARAIDAAKNAKYLRVDALPTSEPILRSMGFQSLGKTWPCDWEPREI